eukprot:SAG11_NODE_232_length_11930_cov_6.884794_7_plen_184_part_00
MAATPTQRTTEKHRDAVLAAVAKSTSTVRIFGKPTAVMTASRSELLANVKEQLLDRFDVAAATAALKSEMQVENQNLVDELDVSKKQWPSFKADDMVVHQGAPAKVLKVLPADNETENLSPVYGWAVAMDGTRKWTSARWLSSPPAESEPHQASGAGAGPAVGDTMQYGSEHVSKTRPKPWLV